MSLATLSRAGGASRRAPPVLLMAVALALVCAALVSLPMAQAVWQTGRFNDTDDVMRLTQVRDLLQGQGWFDMTARRLDPPVGVFMHWSRVVDAPLALLIGFFGLFADAEQAERLARLVFPLALQGVLFLAMATAGRVLIGAAGMWPAVLAAFLGAPMFGQFQPGRIDHHAPQIVLLVGAFASMAAALDPARARLAALSGLAIAVSLAISLENLPFIAVLAAMPALAFVVQGAAARPLLLWFAAGLGLGLPALYAATIAPGRWALAYCDALSLAQATPALALVAAFVGLAALAPRTPAVATRLAFAISAGVAIVALFAMAFPACLGSPLAATDPLVREVWLDHVREVMPLGRLLARDPGQALAFAVPVTLGAAGAALRARGSVGLECARWRLLLVLICAGLVVGAWHIRVFSSVMPLAGLGALGGAMALTKLGARRHALLGGPLALLLALFAASPFGWSVIAAAAPSAAANAAESPDRTACYAPENLRGLDALAPGLALTHMDSGAYVLGYTRHSVLAAPYHRDNHGNRAMIEVWSAPEPVARARLAELGVRYVFFCSGASDARTLAKSHPDGLAAALEAGRPPSWLVEIPSKTDAYRVYSVLTDAVK